MPRLLKLLVIAAVAFSPGAWAEAPPTPVEPGDENCTGLPISSVRFAGCEADWSCGRPDVVERLVRLAELPPGTSYLAGAAEGARERIVLTRLFKSVRRGCEVDASGAWADLTFHVEPNRRIRHIEVRGNANLYDSDIFDRLGFRTGGIYNPGDAATEKERQRQASLLVRRYAKEGFGGAQVTIDATVTGPESVDLQVLVMEGDRRRMGAIAVEVSVPGGDAPTVAGAPACPTFSARTLRQAAKLESGEPYTERRRREAERLLEAFLRSRGIMDPSVALVPDATAERTRVAVKYARCAVLSILGRDEPAPGRLGYAPVNDDAVLDALTFGESGNFDFEESLLSREALELHYQQLGHLFADVVLDYRELPVPPGLATEQLRGPVAAITFLVTTNWPKEIRAIDFVGALGLPADELLQGMKTKVYDFFGAGGFLLVDQMMSDLDSVRRRHVDAGYHRFRFTDARPEANRQPGLEVVRSGRPDAPVLDYYQDDLHFRVTQPKGENVLYVTVPVDVGTPSRVGDIDIDEVAVRPHEGARQTGAVQLADVRTRLEAVPGDVFSPGVVARDASTIEAAYQAAGHHDFALEVLCAGRLAGGDFAPGCGSDGLSPCDEDHCDYRTVRADRIDLRFRVSPGPSYEVGEVFVIGHGRTAEPLIRKSLPRTGEPLSRIAIDEAGRQLRLLGVFSDVQLHLVGLPSAARDGKIAPLATPASRRIAIVVELQEATSEFIEVRTGIQTLVAREGEGGIPAVGGAVSSSVGAVDGVTQGPVQAVPLEIPNFLNFWGLAYRDVNFLGRAIEFELPLKYGLSLPESATDGEAWASAFSRLIELRPTLYEPRLLGTNVGLRGSVFVRYDRATREVDEFETGGTTELAVNLTRNLRSSLAVTASAIASGDDCDDGPCTLPSLLERDDPLAPTVDVALGATLDYLDNAIHPTQGFAIGTRLRYILSRGTDERGATGDIGNFLLWELNLRGVVNVRKFLIVAAYFRYADSLSFGEDKNVPNRYRYRLGGINGIRGLADNSVRTFDEAGLPNLVQEGGDSLMMGTVELRLPLFQRDIGGIWLGLFVDWGGLAESLLDFNRESFRFTAGVGLRYLLSGIAIRLDVGFNPLQRCEIETGVADPRCDPGKLEPVSQTHFGLLYTF
ncbi:MAG: BamA/TamA family outer membrane protein [Myxococcales bacterium]|nr:BamA/TamA family outer membrane protein [Myxococcales bacterium]